MSECANSEWDTKIFILTLIMSSLFLYNTKNVIDARSFQELAITKNLADHIQINKNSPATDNISLKNECPDFIWVLRDCFLNENKSDTDYLKRWLKEKKNDNMSKDMADIREALKKSFKSHCCFRLPSPVGEAKPKNCFCSWCKTDNNKTAPSVEERLRNLDKIPYDDLKENFKSKMDKMCSYVIKNVNMKTVNGRPVNGQVFIEYIKDVIESINNDQRIILIDAFNAGIRAVAQSALDSAEKLFVDSFDNFIEKNKLPIKWKMFDEEQLKITGKCYDIIKNSVVGSEVIVNEYLKKFGNFVHEDSIDSVKTTNGKLSHYRNLNSKAILSFNNNVLTELWNEKVRPEIVNKSSLTMTIDEFEKLIESFNALYNSQAMEGPEKSEAISDFLNKVDLQTIKQNIKNWNDEYATIISDWQSLENKIAQATLAKEEAEILRKNIAQEIEKVHISYMEEKERTNQYIKSLANELKQMQDQRWLLGTFFKFKYKFR